MLFRSTQAALVQRGREYPARAMPTRYSPRQNQLLGALARDDYERLLPQLEPVALARGSTVYGASAQVQYLYFLTEGVVSHFHETESGASAAVDVTGKEGVIGLAPLLGCQHMPGHARVLSAGHAYRMPAAALQHGIGPHERLPQVFLRYTHVLLAQAMQTAVCNRHHYLEQQLCRWLLCCLDRVSSNELTLTHAVLADMLGVRREGVTEAARKLQQAGALEYARGHIAVRDRRYLEASTCECYAVIKREYDVLLRSTARSTLCHAA